MSPTVPPGIDPELARAAALQPELDYSQPATARLGLARAVKLSRMMSRSYDLEHGLHMTERHVPARGGSPDVGVRIYEPLARDALLPALVFFHGGGFVAGDLETDHVRCATLSREGAVVVVSVDYRLAPEHPYPAGVHDCYDVLAWVHENAEQLGVDPDLIAVGGNSAGGAFAAAVALMARDGGGPPIALALLLYPVVDDRLATPSMREFLETPGWNGRNSVHMWKHYLGALAHTGAVPPYAAPARASELGGLPDTHIVTAEFDPLRDEAREYASRLTDAGVNTRLREFSGTFHGFDAAVPNARVSVQALREQSALLREGSWRSAVAVRRG
jgi:acetyl esterase